MNRSSEDMENMKKVREALEFLRSNSKYIPDALETSHRTTQQLIMKDVIVKAIKHWYLVYNDEHYIRYDLRNEATVKLCDQIVNKIKDLDYLPLI